MLFFIKKLKHHHANRKMLLDQNWYQTMGGGWRDSHAFGYIPAKDLWLPPDKFMEKNGLSPRDPNWKPIPFY